MLGLPKSTEYNKRIPKQKFYENLKVTPAMRRIFIEQIQTIYWRNKIAPTTTNLSAGKTVAEVELIELKLSKVPLGESVLRQIDKEIPYHIVFILEFEGKYQAWTAYKEATKSGVNTFKVGSYYHCDWLSEEDLPLKLDGLDIDKVYENFVRQIAGDALQAETTDETLADTVAKDEKRKALEKQIVLLQAKIRKEKQLNMQMQLNGDLKLLREELAELL